MTAIPGDLNKLWHNHNPNNPAERNQSMRSLRKITLGAMIAVSLSVGLVLPASATTRPTVKTAAVTVSPDAPIPSCGEHFALQRSGRNVRVVGVNLNAFSRGYMFVWAAAHDKSFGPFNASPYGGANFVINTGSSSQTTVAISLTNDSNKVTLCAQDYYV
jgi:hypothetical protein